MSRNEREAWIVVDLGFGDAGKGSVTDFLVRDRGADLVVRFNGGAQAGHNVVTDAGLHHTFSQFCAGTLAGAPGLLGPDFLLHPLGMAVEAEHLQRTGIADPWAWVAVDRRARVITPYQQATGRIREQLRGASAHGTCGVGVGECVRSALEHPEDTLCAGQLGEPDAVRARLSAQRERLRAELVALGATDLSIFDDRGLIDRVIDAWRHVAARLRILSPEATHATIDGARRVVFEGAQGLLLDESWGFHPHTTWSDCTPAGALALAGTRSVTRLGVIRSYAVRHGPGPFPTEGGPAPGEPHNTGDGWQGDFRVGALDGVLLRYALQICGGADGLAITCLDQQPRPPVCPAYRGPPPEGLARGTPERITALVPGSRDDLAHRERLGRWLRTVSPVLEQHDPVAFVEDATDTPVWLQGWGPGPGAKRWCGARASIPEVGG